ncbi:ribonuclease H-like domain-containing protein [Tanacetum coccineum]
MAISSSSSSSSSDNKVQNCSKCLESFKCLQKNYDTEREKHNKAKLEIRGYEIALESLKARIIGHEKNELAWGERYEFQNYDLKWSSKNLTKILNSQMSAHDKNGLGFGTQMDDLSNKSETDSENSLTIFEVRSSDEESTLANNRFTKANKYHAVPPPITGNPLTPRADISFAGLDEYAFRNKIIESKTTETNKTVGTTNEATIVKPKSVNETVVSKSKINRDEVIIEDWTSDDEDDVSAKKIVSSVKPKVTQVVRSQADKSGQTSQKQGIGFKKVHKIKACFVCKSTSHLIKDCDFYDQKSPEPRVKNVVNTGERVVKPVWNYGKRVNHQNFSKILKYPHAKRTFNPSAVLTRAGLVNTDRSNVSTARSISTVRPVRPVSTARPLASKIAQSNSVIRPKHPRLDIVRPKASNTPIKRSYFTQPVYRPKDLKPDVKTFGVNNMTTVGTRAVVSKGKVENVLKKAKWVWRPKMNYQDHVYKYNGSYMLKKFLVVDSGCSSHMTGNKAYLSDFEDFNEGFVAFRSDPKGGKIMGKGKIKTANLDFDDVYFVDELKFNLFSVSQMCDKKNSVLFTESECLILSPSFKLLDESQVVLRAPRKDDVYSLDLKNIVPSGGKFDGKSDEAFEEEKRRIASQKKAAQATSTNQLSTDRPFVSTDRSFVSTDRSNTPNVKYASTSTDASDTLPNDGIFNGAYDDDKDVGAVADFNNMDNTIAVSPIPTLKLLILEAIRLFLAFATYMGFLVYQMDVKSAFLYDTIEEEVYVHQTPGFVDPAQPNKVYKVVKALYGLHQLLELGHGDTLFLFLLENDSRYVPMGRAYILFGLHVKQNLMNHFISKRAVVNTGKGKLNTDLKRSRWVWRPKGNYLDHVSKDSRSFMLKKGNPEILLQDHAVVDSGCSSHMTGNKAYLSDYEDFNGGFMAFGSDPKGGLLKVKSLEIALKRKSKKVIVSASEGEELEDQGRIIQDIDDDPLVSLFRESMKEKSTDFVTPTKASGEAQEEEISPTILEAAKTLSKVASQSVSKAKSTDKGKRYRRRARSMAKNINTGLDAEDEINTSRVEINTGIEDVNTGSTKVDTGRTSISTSSIILSPKKGQREGKAQMVEEDIQATHKTKEQIRQEEAGLEEAIRLQAQMDEEVAKQIHLDKMLAKRVQEEQELAKLEDMTELEQETSKKQKIDIEDASITKGKDEIVKEEEAEVPVKKTGMRRKQKARKGINIDKTAQDEFNKEREAYVKDKVKDASSESEIGVDVIPTATKPLTIVNWKIISQSSQKAAYQIIRKDGSDKTYMSFGAIMI